MQQFQAERMILGIGFLSQTCSTDQTTVVTDCYIYHITVWVFFKKNLVQTGLRLTFKCAIISSKSFFQSYF